MVNETKAAKPAPKPKKPAGHGVSVVVLAVSVVAALAVGLLVGKFLLGGAAGGSLSGKSFISESELDATVGTYVYNGTSSAITAREALESSNGLEASKQQDGTYLMPSADAVLSYARNQVLNSAVEAEGITVSDEDMTAYAKETLGTDSYSDLATQYGMSEDGVKKIVRESAGVKKLYDKVVGDAGAGEAPEAPAQAAEGQEDTPNADYGAYIVKLLGDEWDGEGNKWAREDGPYYQAMKDMEFSKDSATYNQAMQAYYVAYQQYSQTASNASTKWTDYVNGLLSKASISIGEIVS